ncbi:MAG: hypothetical protein IT183_08460 [Acidobacteria bacterium]|nr:hypothetical protein [Acidobacteriota bacterium]
MAITRRARRRSSAPLAVFAFMGCLLALTGRALTQAPELIRLEGNLPDGTPWEIVVPNGWNGTLLLDLDFASSQQRYAPLYARGFAGAGITRGEGAGDAQANASRFLLVLDLFVKNFRQPTHTIANGRSRGGVTAVVMMETYPDRIDGALGQCTVPGYVPSYNQKLDHAFVARVLLEADLAIVDIPTATAEYTALTGAWSKVLTAAQATPQGKARIALAHALGQLPVWSSPSQPRPEPGNVDQIQQSMFNTLQGQFMSRLGIRRTYEQAAGGVFNWNTGVDYPAVFNEMVRPEVKVVVEELYRRAGLNLAAELQRVNNAPRIAASPAAVLDVQRRGGHTGNPTRPLLLNQVIGDATTQVVTTQSYVEKARANGKDALVREVFSDVAGHCNFSTASYAAVVEALDERVRTGVWPDTSPAAMNARARAIDPNAAPVFVDYKAERFARPFFLDDVYQVEDGRP